MTERLLAVTHNGKFHADEVFGTAVLNKLYPELEVIRSRDPAVMVEADFVYDVGGVYDHANKRYDHHQRGAHKRENGLTYSAFGLIWLHYGLEYCEGDEAAQRRIDKVLVRGIDAGDNGERNSMGDLRAPEYDVSQIIEQLNPVYGKTEQYDAQFAKAVGRATEMLSRLYEKVQGELTSAREVREALQQSPDPRYAVLDHHVELSDCVAEIEGLEYVVFPEPVNHTWQVFAVPVPGQPFVKKRPLPEQWAGLMNHDLAELTGVSDAMFCHTKRFLAVAETREGALSLLSLALADSTTTS